jgi:hypothetical protein
MGKLNHHAEKVTSCDGLPEDVVDRVGTSRSCALNKCLTETNLLDLVGLNSMTGYVINSICRPDESMDLH